MRAAITPASRDRRSIAAHAQRARVARAQRPIVGVYLADDSDVDLQLRLEQIGAVVFGPGLALSTAWVETAFGRYPRAPAWRGCAERCTLAWCPSRMSDAAWRGGAVRHVVFRDFFRRAASAFGVLRVLRAHAGRELQHTSRSEHHERTQPSTIQVPELRHSAHGPRRLLRYLRLHELSRPLGARAPRPPRRPTRRQMQSPRMASPRRS